MKFSYFQISKQKKESNSFILINLIFTFHDILFSQVLKFVDTLETHLSTWKTLKHNFYWYWVYKLVGTGAEFLSKMQWKHPHVESSVHLKNLKILEARILNVLGKSSQLQCSLFHLLSQPNPSLETILQFCYNNLQALETFFQIDTLSNDDKPLALIPTKPELLKNKNRLSKELPFDSTKTLNVEEIYDLLLKVTDRWDTFKTEINVSLQEHSPPAWQKWVKYSFYSFAFFGIILKIML